ncbi:DotA/TraY family protein [Aeromonas jandaei]|uniref:DotA/TraY family protein n=1 Tax=Aeromonas jandaei TaxID=650 RepID=UPI003B9E749F
MSGWDQFKPEQGDAAITYLRQIFGQIVDLVYQGNTNGGAPVDSTIGAFMSVFGAGAYFLGMLFFVWHVVMGMLKSGEDGRFLGNKSSQVMRPVRVLVGSTLLFPAKNGFSLIQILVLWLALQGAGMGSKSFIAVLNFFKETQMILQPSLPDARPLVLSIARSELCKEAMNKHFSETGSEARVSFKSRDISHSSNLGHSGSDQTIGYGPSTTVHYREYSWRVDGDGFDNEMICGGLQFQTKWEGVESNKGVEQLKNPIYMAHAEGINAIIERVRPPIKSLVADNQKPSTGFVQSAINDYTSIMSRAAAKAVNETNAKATTDFIKYAEDGGFMYAGTWVGHINRMNDAVQQTLNDLPTTKSLPLSDRFDDVSLRTYHDYLIALDQATRSSNENIALAYQNNVGTVGGDDGAISKVNEFVSNFFMGMTRLTIGGIAGDNTSHLTQMRAFGDNLLIAAELAAVGMAATAGGSDSLVAKVTVGTAFSIPAALQALGGILTTALLSVFVFGLMLAVYIPFVPLISWIMGVLNWLLLVAEAVLASPLFAAAHISPNGEEEIGTAGEGYRMLTGLVMKPSLMVIALIVALTLQNSVAGFINDSFMPYAQGVQSGSMVGFVKYLGLIAVYVLMMLALVHACMALIHWLPDRAMLWLGRSVAGLGGSERVESETKGGMERFGNQAFNAGMKGITAAENNAALEEGKRTTEPAANRESRASKGYNNRQTLS